jgi:hypothetical protein
MIATTAAIYDRFISILPKCGPRKVSSTIVTIAKLAYAELHDKADRRKKPKGRSLCPK